MTLVDEQQLIELLDLLKQRFGIKKRAGGGSAANTIYAISQFSGQVFYSCKVAGDESGDFYVDELQDANIDTNLLAEREHGVTGRCLVMISPDTERTMLTFLGISETFSKQDLNQKALLGSEYLYIEGYLVTSPTAQQAAIEAKTFAENNDIKIAITLSDPAMVEYFRNNFEDIIGSGVDLLFCNEQEALMWTGEDNIEDASTQLKKIAKQFAITLGDKGALLFDGSSNINIEPNEISAVDSNGAGDMFAGAFLYAITHGHDFETAGNFASLAASTVVSNFGPRLDKESHKQVLEGLK